MGIIIFLPCEISSHILYILPCLVHSLPFIFVAFHFFFFSSSSFPLQLSFIFMRPKFSSLATVPPIFIISLYFLVLVLLTREKKKRG